MGICISKNNVDDKMDETYYKASVDDRPNEERTKKEIIDREMSQMINSMNKNHGFN